jgi:hypothetical protein
MSFDLLPYKKIPYSNLYPLPPFSIFILHQGSFLISIDYPATPPPFSSLFETVLSCRKMSQKEIDISDLLGNSYPGSWRSEITDTDEARLRSSYSIPSSITLRFAAKKTGATVRDGVHEVCVYEDMFKAGFRFPFPRVVRELLHFLQIAPHQLTPNAWKIFFACVVLWPKALGEGKNLSVKEFLKIYELTEVPGAEYLFNFQERLPTKFIQLTGRPNSKAWRKRFFFAQGDWEFSMTEIIKDPDVPREARLPSVVRREEPALNSDEENRINRLWKYAHEFPSKMKFEAIFSMTILAAYLRYPQIEGLGDEMLSEGSKSQLTRKRSGADLEISRLPIPGGKRSKVFSDNPTLLTDEPLQRPLAQLSLPKEMAVPRKSRYDKGKSKVNPNSLEDPQPVGSLSALCIGGRKDISTVLDLLASTHPSREVSVSVTENNPLVIPSRDMSLIAKGSDSLISPLFEVTHPPSLPSVADSSVLPAIGAIQENAPSDAESMEPSASNEADRSEAFPSQTDPMDDGEAVGSLRGHSANGRFFTANPNVHGPSSHRTPSESIKFLGREINWAGDPLEALADLIPRNPTTDAAALSRNETTNKMFRHLIDVSPINFSLSPCAFIEF